MIRDLTNVIGYIYKITSPNGKIYIGQTINLKERKRAYKGNSFKKQTHLWNNCQKYNWNPSETIEIIDECLCGEGKDSLNEREIYWIDYFDSFRNGLNCTEGGKGQLSKIWTEEQKINASEGKKNGKVSSRVYEKLSDETKQKIREKLKGGKLTEEHKANISKGQTGIPHKFKRFRSEETKQKIKERIAIQGANNTGKKFSEEAKKNMSEAHKGKRTKNSKAMGISFRKDSNKWRARIQVDGKTINLGNFILEEEARQVYLEAKNVYHSGM